MSMVARRSFALFGGLFVAACLSPTLPLPPPSEPEVSGPTEQGLIRLTGNAPGGAWMYALNKTSNVGVFNRATPEGRYDLEIPAEVGHRIALWYELDGEQSESLLFTVRTRP
ncbi:MAG TPA: hypothetical protein VFQ61_28800 [Polyangiaceae bacterium]|nr:hypothetical protein [Polyangiaceae bacterium]